MRLDKLLAHCGYGTRKEVKSIIKKGYVFVNDVMVKQDKYQIDPDNDIIVVNDERIEYQEFVYYMLNKPQGYVSATEDIHYPTVVDLIGDYNHEIFPIGRLDIDTEGLLILSNDGKLAHDLLSPKKHCSKIYYVEVEGIVDDEDQIIFKEGVVIDTGYKCLSSSLKVLKVENGMSYVEITIYEGKYHQVKKMFKAVGKKVVFLKRIQMGNLRLDPNLKLGEYKILEKEDLDSLMSKNMLE